MSYTAKCGIVALLLFPFSPSPSAAQPTTPYGEKSPHKRFRPALTVILIVLIATLFFICIFYIYIRNCSNNTNGSNVNPVNGRTDSSLRGMRGLEALMIETFPAMVYSDASLVAVGKSAVYAVKQEPSALLGRIPSAVGYQPTLATDLGGLHECITTTKKGSITSVQAIYVPADDLIDPALQQHLLT